MTAFAALVSLLVCLTAHAGPEPFSHGPVLPPASSTRPDYAVELAVDGDAGAMRHTNCAEQDEKLCCVQVRKAETPNTAARPNIVWIMAEDISTELACYGHPAVKTPHLDALASQGARYTNAFCTAPSCTPSRNAMMTGVYQTRTDTQDQRRRGITLPDGIQPITHLLQKAGYYTALGCGYSTKTDLNFTVKNLFDGGDWGNRDAGQPFFAQITLPETHRQRQGWDPIRKRSKHPVDPARVELPPYFPDSPVCRKDWAQYLDAMEFVDNQVGKILERLEQEGIADNTVVIFFGDNGRCHLRGKCWLYDPGIHVPLIVRWPNQVKPGQVIGDMVSMIDISATTLDVAGVELPDYLDGHPILGPRAKKRDHIFAARDLIDEVMDHIRCVRTERFKYIRNYTPENGYRECEYVQQNRPMLADIMERHAKGELNEVQQLLLAKRKASEELYDVQADPHEVHNLAQSPAHQTTLVQLRALLDRWIDDTGDQGLARMTDEKENRK
jgi:arylsulfatase A-like enzyme